MNGQRAVGTIRYVLALHRFVATMTMLKRAPSLFLALISVTCAVAGPPNRVAWTGKVVPPSVRAGQSAQLVVSGTIEKGWHIYGFKLDQREGPVWTKLALAEESLVKPNGDPVQPKPLKRFDRGFKFDIQYHEGAVALSLPVQIQPGKLGKQQVILKVTYQACNDQSCDPPKTAEIPISFDIQPGEPEVTSIAPITSIPEQPEGHVTESSPQTPTTPGGLAAVTDEQAKAIQDAEQSGLLAYIWLSFTAGLLALLTPCVWPMVPITVSFFSKKSETETKSNKKAALAYCAGIIGTFTGLGVLMTVLFGSTGIQRLAASPWVNLGIAILFIVLAMNLLGLFEIILPSSLVNKAQKASSGGGLLGPVLMGLTFSLTTFTCTVPFVGTLLVAATKGSWIFPVMGMLAFSLAFAIPFFFLALFPQYLARMPKSGGWLTAVKVTMGFLELAAALKFLSSAELVWQMGYLTKAVFLAIWSAIFALAALYLFGWVLLANHPDKPRIGVLRRLIGVGMLGAAVYCLAAINGAPLGQLAGFPPPDPYPGRSGQTGSIAWKHDFDSAFAQAQAEKKPLFINFTGVTCTNCRYMEQDVFPQKDIAAGINQFVPVELYTDRGTPEDNKNAALREKLTNSVTNPVYVVLAPDMKVLKVFQGSSVTPDQFQRFLADAKNECEKWTSLQASR